MTRPRLPSSRQAAEVRRRLRAFLLCVKAGSHTFDGDTCAACGARRGAEVAFRFPIVVGGSSWFAPVSRSR